MAQNNTDDRRGYLMGRAWIEDVENTIWGNLDGTMPNPSGSLFWHLRPAKITSEWIEDETANINGIAVFRADAVLLINGREPPENEQKTIKITRYTPDTSEEVPPDQTNEEIVAMYRGNWEVLETGGGGHLTGTIAQTAYQNSGRSTRFVVMIPPKPARNSAVNYQDEHCVRYEALAPCIYPGDALYINQIVSISKNRTLGEWEIIAAECF